MTRRNKRRVSKKNKSHYTYTPHYNDSRDTITSLKSQISGLIKSRDNWKKKAKAFEQKAITLNAGGHHYGNVNKLYNDFARVEKELGEKDIEIKGVKKSLRVALSDRDRCYNAYVNEYNKATDLEAVVESQKEEVERLKKSNKGTASSSSTVEAANHNLETIEALRLEIASFEEIVSSLQGENKQLKLGFVDSVKKLTDRCMALEKENKKLTILLRVSKENEVIASDAIARLDVENSDLTGICDNLNKDAEAMEEEISRLRKENSDLKSANDDFAIKAAIKEGRGTEKHSVKGGLFDQLLKKIEENKESVLGLEAGQMSFLSGFKEYHEFRKIIEEWIADVESRIIALEKWKTEREDALQTSSIYELVESVLRSARRIDDLSERVEHNSENIITNRVWMDKRNGSLKSQIVSTNRDLEFLREEVGNHVSFANKRAKELSSKGLSPNKINKRLDALVSSLTDHYSHYERLKQKIKDIADYVSANTDRVEQISNHVRDVERKANRNYAKLLGENMVVEEVAKIPKDAELKERESDFEIHTFDSKSPVFEFDVCLESTHNLKEVVFKDRPAKVSITSEGDGYYLSIAFDGAKSNGEPKEFPEDMLGSKNPPSKKDDKKDKSQPAKNNQSLDDKTKEDRRILNEKFDEFASKLLACIVPSGSAIKCHEDIRRVAEWHVGSSAREVGKIVAGTETYPLFANVSVKRILMLIMNVFNSHEILVPELFVKNETGEVSNNIDYSEIAYFDVLYNNYAGSLREKGVYGYDHKDKNMGGIGFKSVVSAIDACWKKSSQDDIFVIHNLLGDIVAVLVNDDGKNVYYGKEAQEILLP